MASVKRATRTKIKDATVVIEAANKSTNEDFIKLYLKAGYLSVKIFIEIL